MPKRKGKGSKYPDKWDPDEGDKLVGKVVRSEIVKFTSKFGDSKGEKVKVGVIEVKDKDGDKVSLICGNHALSILFDSVEKGDKVSIRFDGEESGRFGRKLYKIKVNDEELDLEYEEDDDEDEEEEDDEDEEEEDDDE